MWREYVRIALRALAAHKFRSSLTVSSITLGAFSIVLMSSLATSGLTTLVDQFESLGGARILMIAPKRPERQPDKASVFPGEITKRDRDLLFAALPHVEAHSMYATIGERVDFIDDRGNRGRTDLVAADAGFLDLLHLHLAKGRFFTEEEDEHRARVCVVGSKLAQKLGGDPVGRWITIGLDRCLVIGTIAKVDYWDVNFGFDWHDFVAMPLQTVFDSRPETRQEAFIQILTDGTPSNDIVKRIANAIMLEQHHGIDDFEIWDFNRFMAQLYTIFAIMETVVGLIASIALVVGGIGVMNMMLVSVSERTKEIGIRKALGASPGAIASQFLWEASVLAGAGGLSGTAAGVVSAIGVNLLIHHLEPLWIGEISWTAAAIAMTVSLAIGVSFGFLPARRAGSLDPVEAMRR